MKPMKTPCPPHHAWFPSSRYGLFIHWGPYAAIGRGEQVLVREHLDQRQYERDACAWNPRHADPAQWAQAAVDGGFRYAVLTARHHDGYCLWDSHLTDYTSVRQAPKRDFVHEYVEAFRQAGLRVGLYYSLGDFRIPAYWRGANDDAEGWSRFRQYIHDQVGELLTRYGKIDVLWFDGAWPHNAAAWRSHDLLAAIRQLQPHILVNNRLDSQSVLNPAIGAVEAAGESSELGDFGTPEHHITADPDRLWESCQTSTSRLWGYTIGEHWRTVEQLLSMLCDAASKGGNLLLNVGPDGEGRIPPEFIERSNAIGRWLKINGEAIFGTRQGHAFEFVTRGYQTRRDHTLYLILRFHDRRSTLHMTSLATRVRSARLLGAGSLRIRHEGEVVVLEGLPPDPPLPPFAVIEVECEGEPRPHPWDELPLWYGDPRRYASWAEARGKGLMSTNVAS